MTKYPPLREGTLTLTFTQRSRLNNLLDGNLGAPDCLAGKGADFTLDELDHAIFIGVNGEVATGISAGTGDLSSADLANYHLAGINLLPAETLDAQAVTGVVVYILGGTASFNVGHT